MRQIKFRVWDVRRKKFLEEDSFFICSKGEVFINYGECEPFRYNWDEYIPTQFIGLLDSTGKEIYEGDILESPSGIIKHVVVWDENNLGYYLAEKTLSLYTKLNPDYIHKYTIIGNIYENPELTETKS